MRLPVALLTVGLTVMACGSQETAIPAAGSGVSRVAFLPEEDVYPMALLTGTLGGDVKTGCLWVGAPLGEGERVAVRLHDDTAELDVSAQPPVIRDGNRVLAAFGDAVEMGGGDTNTPAAPGCADHGTPFIGHGLQRALPGVPPTVTLADLRRVCGPTGGSALAGTLLVAGIPRQPLVLQVNGPDGTLIANVQLPAVEGTRELLVPLDDAPTETPPEWIVTVSEREQALTQTLLDLRPGPACG